MEKEIFFCKHRKENVTIEEVQGEKLCSLIKKYACKNFMGCSFYDTFFNFPLQTRNRIAHVCGPV